MKAFISYSHKDSKYLERLKVHLAPMKRDSKIQEWTDHEIHAGESFDDVIKEALESSQLFIALVSPDYLASGYCYEKEFMTALEMQSKDILTIVAIIVEPCEWKMTPFSKFKALPLDGKPISEWTSENNAYLNVVSELRRLTAFKNEVLNTAAILNLQNSNRNYKVKLNFSEVDRIDFKKKSFEEIKRYFKSAVSEIDTVENVQARFVKDGNDRFTCLISNRSTNQSKYLTISIANQNGYNSSDLQYEFSESLSTNTFYADKDYIISNDDYEQFWTQRISMWHQSESKFSDVELASHIWEEFIAQVGIS